MLFLEEGIIQCSIVQVVEFFRFNVEVIEFWRKKITQCTEQHWNCVRFMAIDLLPITLDAKITSKKLIFSELQTT